VKDNARFICVSRQVLSDRTKKAEVAAMPIESYLASGVFLPEATAAMGEAFDAACEELHIPAQPNVLRSLIAILIIAAARRGELDPARLRTAAVEGFSIVTSHRDLDGPTTKQPCNL
jgi:hypothetical protein